jgi:hypothetical protein
MNVVHASSCLWFILMLPSYHRLIFQPHSFSRPPTYMLICYCPCTPHASWFDHHSSIWQRVKIMNLLIQEFFSASTACVLLVICETTLYTHIKEQAKFSCSFDSLCNNISPSVTCIQIRKSWAWQLHNNCVGVLVTCVPVFIVFVLCFCIGLFIYVYSFCFVCV